MATWEKVPLSVKVGGLFHRVVVPSHRAGIPWKRPLLAAGMGAVVIGSGHLYTGRWLEGVALLAAALVLTWAIFNVSLWALFFLAVIWQWQIINAYDRAADFDWASINQAEMRGR